MSKGDPIYAQVNEYLEYCEFVKQVSPMTLTAKKSCYKQFIEQSRCRDLEELDNADYNRWVKAQAKKGISPRTINMRSAHIVCLIKYHREMGMTIPIKLPLIQKLKEGPVRRVFYLRDDIAKVLSAIDLDAEDDFERRQNLMDWLLIRVCFDTGLRITELRNLQLDSFNGRQINFIGKGFKERKVWIATETYEYLQEWIEVADVTDWLWVNEYHRHLCNDELRIRMRKVFEKAGYDNFYPHALRHTFGTDIQKQGATLLEMQQMLGHARAETTERYIHGLEGEQEKLFNHYREVRFAT